MIFSIGRDYLQNCRIYFIACASDLCPAMCVCVEFVKLFVLLSRSREYGYKWVQVCVFMKKKSFDLS